MKRRRQDIVSVSDLRQEHIEAQRRIARNVWRRTLGAVAELRWDDKLSSLSHPHAVDAELPALDHFTSSESEPDVALIKDLASHQAAHVVHDNELTFGSLGGVVWTRLDNLILQPARQPYGFSRSILRLHGLWFDI